MISLSLRVAMLIAIVLYFALLILLVKKRTLSLKYSLMWFFAGFLMLILAIFPGLLGWLADVVGIELPVNALFAFLLFCGLIILVILSSIASKQSERLKQLTQQMALLEQRLRDLEKDGK